LTDADNTRFRRRCLGVLGEVLGEEGEENAFGGAAPGVVVGEFEYHDVVELESGRFVNCSAGGGVGGGHDSISLV
jgi:hypothetical protein